MLKKGLGLGLVILLFYLTCFGEEDMDTFTITTYYPSPYGVYNEGTLYYDNNTNQLMLCQQTGSLPDTYAWKPIE